METRRQRTRILLRAAIGGGAGKEKTQPKHHTLQLSDGSESGDSPAKESDTIASLSGSGVYCDRRTVGMSSPTTTTTTTGPAEKLRMTHSSPSLRRNMVFPSSGNADLCSRSVEKITDDIIAETVPVPTTTTTATATTTTAAPGGSDKPCPFSPKTPLPRPPPSNPMGSSVPSVANSTEIVEPSRTEAGSIPALETTSPNGSKKSEIPGADKQTTARDQPRATAPDVLQNSGHFLLRPHNSSSKKNRVLSSESEPKVHAIRRRQKVPLLKVPPSRSSSDSSPSPQSVTKTALVGDIPNPQKPSRTRPMKAKPPRSARVKKGRNQIHPEHPRVGRAGDRGSSGGEQDQPPLRPMRHRVSEPQKMRQRESPKMRARVSEPQKVNPKVSETQEIHSRVSEPQQMQLRMSEPPQVPHRVSKSARMLESQQAIHRTSGSPEPPDTVDGSFSVTRSFSPVSSASIQSRPSSSQLLSRPSSSLFDTARSSTSVLTPLRTCSLRLHSLPLEGRWDMGGESQLESFFPDKHIRVYIVTWNMQEIRDLPASLDDLLLPLSQEVAADMFVIGTQESTPCRREWELLLQKTLGPFYVMVQSSSIGVIYLCFFMRRDLIWFCSATTSANFATRPVNIIKTKGAVGISFTLFGSSFLFITSHFTASSHKVAERNADMHKIATNLTLCDDVPTGGFSGDVTSKFDYVFWFGDLNYRVEMSRQAADKCLRKNDIMSLLLRDQLTREILQGNTFLGFSEQPINFPPSYKFDPDTDDYDTSEKQRVPSWTDRILFKSRAGDGIVGCGYTSCQSLRCSDHKPVCGVFRVRLDASHHVEGVPSSVAGYDREIYMRANKQRSIILAVARASEEMDDTRNIGSSRKGHAERRGAVTSQVCTIL